MKILLFTDNLGAGGAQRQLAGLAILLKEAGYNVKLCTYGKDDFYGNLLQEHNVIHEVIPNSEKSHLRWMFVIRYFVQQKPDWIVSYQMTPNAFACISKLFVRNCRVLASDRGIIQTFNLRKRLLLKTYYLADALVPNSHKQADILSSHYPILSKKIIVIPNFVDLSRFRLKHFLRRNDDIPIITVVASLYPLKNATGLISALKMVIDTGRRIAIRWYGYDSDKNEYYKICRNLIEQYGLGDSFTFFPKRLDIETVYHESDYFCLPSFAEGTPNVICEAMASGLPILCSNISDNAMYVIPGKNGFLFDPHDVNQISDAIIDALDMDNLQYEKYCRHSRKIAEDNFSEALFLKRYAELLEQ